MSSKMRQTPFWEPIKGPVTTPIDTYRSQLLLLPEAVDDYVGPDNPVRFIEAFADGLDLAAAGFERVAAKETGRPGFNPADMLKLYIYGYINRVRSSRRLEAETHRNIEVIWLLRHLKPDFRTIADFPRVNRAAFKQVFREFVILCRQLDLFGRELLAVDGTRIKAVNNKDRNFTRASLSKFILDRRRESVEHPFGTIKQWMNQGAFLMRGLDNVRGEFSLTALAYNIKRAITIVGVSTLIAAARA
ncbi:transposase [Agrobacterium tumefaciens]|jgi:transposase|uniref:transposase n=1 Tax=Rhizobium sp. TaxID=391 RepID=UPI0035B539E8